mgnify:CR=1 FL=1
MNKIAQWVTAAFPLWVLLCCTLSWFYPFLFTWFTGPLITYGLGFIMLGMGITLKADDFKMVFREPWQVLTGVILQYTVMPLMGWSMARLFSLSRDLTAGLILVACCPGGTASNVISYLAKARVALSVTMTAFSTFMAVALTPLLTTWLIGNQVEVDGWGLFLDALKVILLPVVIGVFLNRYMPRLTARLVPVSPVMAVAIIVLIVASIVGAGKVYIIHAGWRLVMAVVAMHMGGFLLGYVVARLFIRDLRACQTISIEVGMQNSGLGVVLAKNNFYSPLTPIPPAISSAVHSLIGSLLAAVWRIKNSKEISS